LFFPQDFATKILVSEIKAKPNLESTLQSKLKGDSIGWKFWLELLA